MHKTGLVDRVYKASRGQRAEAIDGEWSAVDEEFDESIDRVRRVRNPLRAHLVPEIDAEAGERAQSCGAARHVVTERPERCSQGAHTRIDERARRVNRFADNRKLQGSPRGTEPGTSNERAS